MHVISRKKLLEAPTAHGDLYADLVDVFGTASIVSEMMRGKRELNKQQIRRLSERFGVSPELFF